MLDLRATRLAEVDSDQGQCRAACVAGARALVGICERHVRPSASMSRAICYERVDDDRIACLRLAVSSYRPRSEVRCILLVGGMAVLAATSGCATRVPVERVVADAGVRSTRALAIDVDNFAGRLEEGDAVAAFVAT